MAETPYQARNRRAREAGYRSYGDYRRKVERGQAAPLAPSRLRKASSLEAYRVYVMTAAGVSEEELQGYVREERIRACRAWSETYSMVKITRFSENKARHDSSYLSTYFAAFVMPSRTQLAKDGHAYKLKPSRQLHDYFVSLKGMPEDEWKLRYGRRKLLSGSPPRTRGRKAG